MKSILTYEAAIKACFFLGGAFAKENKIINIQSNMDKGDGGVAGAGWSATETGDDG
jgi:hypothetical protein